MLSIAALLAFAPLLFIGLADGVQGGIVIQNTNTLYVWDDWEADSGGPLQFGGPIVGYPFYTDIKSFQLWNVSESSLLPGYFKFVHVGGPPNATEVREVHADGLPGSSLTAQKFGSIFKSVNPDGATPVIYSFIFLEDEQLAVTASFFAGAIRGKLTLQPYDPFNTLQHFVFYNTSLVTPATAGSGLGEPIPIPIIDGYSRLAHV